MTSQARPRPLVLCVLDGVGNRAQTEANAVRRAKTPNLDALAQKARALLDASGPAVGLPEGKRGNGAHGYTTLGAGRVVRSPVDALDAAANKLRQSPVVDRLFVNATYHGRRLHLVSLLSTAGIHASLAPLFAIIDAAYAENLQVVVHAILDGRDMPPKSAGALVNQLETHLDQKGVIGTIAGRSWAMDRAGRWDRTMKAFSAIVRGDAPRAESAYAALHDAYARGLTDEHVEPIRVGEYEGVKGDFMADFGSSKPVWEWHGEDAGLSLVARPDRMDQLTAMLVRKGVPPEVEAWLTERGKPIYAFDEGWFATATAYDERLGVNAAIPSEPVAESLGEVIAKAGLRQLRCAESERDMHVTSFFSGGRSAPFEGEERRIVASARDVVRWEQRPEMSAAAVTDEVVAAIEGGAHDVILVSYANPDALGHTGDEAAAVRAIEAVDAQIGRVTAALAAAKGAIVVTSGYGNVEQMKDEKGEPHTTHTTNPVPIYVASFTGDPAPALRDGGSLVDVAPTVLDLLGLPKPAVMTGASLLVKRVH